MNPIVASILTLVGVVVLFVLYVLVASGGNFGSLGLACQAFTKTLGNVEFASKIEPLLNPPPPEPPKPVKPSGAPLRVLTILQRESRLVDFLMDNLQGADDGTIAAAVREIQPKAQAALKKHIDLGPVLPEPEGTTVSIPAGFDPSAVQLVGNVTGEPPFQGTIRHAGWRVQEMRIPTPPEGQDEFVLAAAEVELP
jgi:Domain of unknown function (DUF2760)